MATTPNQLVLAQGRELLKALLFVSPFVTSTKPFCMRMLTFGCCSDFLSHHIGTLMTGAREMKRPKTAATSST